MIEYLDKLLEIGIRLIGLEFEIIVFSFAGVAATGLMRIMICGFKQWVAECKDLK